MHNVNDLYKKYPTQRGNMFGASAEPSKQQIGKYKSIKVIYLFFNLDVQKPEPSSSFTHGGANIENLHKMTNEEARTQTKDLKSLFNYTVKERSSGP